MSQHIVSTWFTTKQDDNEHKKKPNESIKAHSLRETLLARSPDMSNMFVVLSSTLFVYRYMAGEVVLSNMT